jgi:carboxypeptidase C (cathepsin A)
MMIRFLLSFAALSGLLAAQETPPEKPEDKKPEAPKEEKKEPKKDDAKEVKPKEVAGQVALGGQDFKYVAQTGTMPILKEDGTARANVFYVYYAATDAAGKRLAATDAAARPITYCFNGGPGAAAVWLHLGGLGPKRVGLAPDGLTPATVVRTLENPNTILDTTDLVFIDPVSTGLSRAAKGEKAEQFYGVSEDVESVSEFIRLFTTREQRWLSPKYLCGESYGVIRAAGVSDFLQDKHGMYFDGLVLLSGLLNFQTLLPGAANDLPYVLGLPALTATAHYHHKLAGFATVDDALAQAREFAQGEYARALLKGDALDDAGKRAIADKLARFTSLPAAQVLEQELRISPTFFREKLLFKERKILGRFDARVTSEDANQAENRPEFDPSFTNVVGPFSAAVNAYIRGDLGYESDHPYNVLAQLPWRYNQATNRYLSMEAELGEAMKTNPRLRVLVLVGRCDLAVPQDSMRYSMAHLPIPASLRKNIAFREFESGHMMYLLQRDAEKLRKELGEFVRGGAK